MGYRQKSRNVQFFNRSTNLRCFWSLIKTRLPHVWKSVYETWRRSPKLLLWVQIHRNQLLRGAILRLLNELARRHLSVWKLKEDLKRDLSWSWNLTKLLKRSQVPKRQEYYNRQNLIPNWWQNDTSSFLFKYKDVAFDSWNVFQGKEGLSHFNFNEGQQRRFSLGYCDSKWLYLKCWFNDILFEHLWSRFSVLKVLLLVIWRASWHESSCFSWISWKLCLLDCADENYQKTHTQVERIGCHSCYSYIMSHWWYFH